MAAGTYNTTADQGATFTRTFEVLDGDNSPINLTGYTFAAQLRKLPRDTGTPIATFACALGVATNEVKITLTNTQTTAIPMVANAKDPRATTRYYYDLEITSPASVVTRLVEGYIDVSPEVTK